MEKEKLDFSKYAKEYIDVMENNSLDELEKNKDILKLDSERLGEEKDNITLRINELKEHLEQFKQLPNWAEFPNAIKEQEDKIEAANKYLGEIWQKVEKVEKQRQENVQKINEVNNIGKKVIDKAEADKTKENEKIDEEIKKQKEKIKEQEEKKDKFGIKTKDGIQLTKEEKVVTENINKEIENINKEIENLESKKKENNREFNNFKIDILRGDKDKLKEKFDIKTDKKETKTQSKKDDPETEKTETGKKEKEDIKTEKDKEQEKSSGNKVLEASAAVNSILSDLDKNTTKRNVNSKTKKQAPVLPDDEQIKKEEDLAWKEYEEKMKQQEREETPEEIEARRKWLNGDELNRDKGIQVQFIAKEQQYKLMVEGEGPETDINMSIEEMNNSEEFIDFCDKLSDDLKSSENVDYYLAYVLSLADDKFGTNKKENYVKALNGEEELLKTTDVYYIMKGVYGREYSKELSDTLMKVANYHSDNKLATVEKNRWTKILEKNKWLRDGINAARKATNKLKSLVSKKDYTPLGLPKGLTDEEKNSRKESQKRERKESIVPTYSMEAQELVQKIKGCETREELDEILKEYKDKGRSADDIEYIANGFDEKYKYFSKLGKEQSEFNKDVDNIKTDLEASKKTNSKSNMQEVIGNIEEAQIEDNEK